VYQHNGENFRGTRWQQGGGGYAVGETEKSVYTKDDASGDVPCVLASFDLKCPPSPLIPHTRTHTFFLPGLFPSYGVCWKRGEAVDYRQVPFCVCLRQFAISISLWSRRSRTCTGGQTSPVALSGGGCSHIYIYILYIYTYIHIYIYTYI